MSIPAVYLNQAELSALPSAKDSSAGLALRMWASYNNIRKKSGD
jgi:hypothetical protein